jgi:hypothetical protein
MVTPAHIVEFLLGNSTAAAWTVRAGPESFVAVSDSGDVFWLHCPQSGPVNLGLLQEGRLFSPTEPLIEGCPANAEFLGGNAGTSS